MDIRREPTQGRFSSAVDTELSDTIFLCDFYLLHENVKFGLLQIRFSSNLR